jgi:small-conductance mechanosensitive channel
MINQFYDIVREFLTDYPWILSLIWVMIIFLVAIVVQKLIGKTLHKVMEVRNIEKHAENAIMLLIRLIILIIALAAILRVAGIPGDIIVAISTLTGTALGLASSRSIGNIFAGMWVLITNPYRVGDYVSFGAGMEGIIKEITLNYTILVTPLNDTVFISNQRVLDKEITNYRIEVASTKYNAPISLKAGRKEIRLKNKMAKKVEYAYKYPILVSFHTQLMPVEKIHQVIDSVLAKYTEVFLEKPKYEAYKRTQLEKGYAIYITVKKAESLFEIVPVIMEDISEKIDTMAPN